MIDLNRVYIFFLTLTTPYPTLVKLILEKEMEEIKRELEEEHKRASDSASSAVDDEKEKKTNTPRNAAISISWSERMIIKTLRNNRN
jgi:hypothetical protein